MSAPLLHAARPCDSPSPIISSSTITASTLEIPSSARGAKSSWSKWTPASSQPWSGCSRADSKTRGVRPHRRGAETRQSPWCCALCGRGGGGGFGGLGGGGLVGLGGNMATRSEVSSRYAHVRLLRNPPRPRFKEEPQLPRGTGLELDSVRPLKSPVSPSAPNPER